MFTLLQAWSRSALWLWLLWPWFWALDGRSGTSETTDLRFGSLGIGWLPWQWSRSCSDPKIPGHADTTNKIKSDSLQSDHSIPWLRFFEYLIKPSTLVLIFRVALYLTQTFRATLGISLVIICNFQSPLIFECQINVQRVKVSLATLHTQHVSGW